MRPTDCPKCGAEFLRRPLLQAEARHCALKIGASAAELMVNERLEAYHEEHVGVSPKETT